MRRVAVWRYADMYARERDNALFSAISQIDVRLGPSESLVYRYLKRTLEYANERKRAPGNAVRPLPC